VVILKWILKRKERGVDLIHLAHYKDRFWVVVNAVLKFGFYEMWKLSTLPEELVVSNEGLLRKVKLIIWLVSLTPRIMHLRIHVVFFSRR
jgi:hypothetical protein